jgi:stearoyl-CoA desaturase (delta-9 desaturase)
VVRVRLASPGDGGRGQPRAAHHRNHHRSSDTPTDIHSPRRGFLWSHVGWILCDKYNPTDFDTIKDFAKYPELRWLNRHDVLPTMVYGIALFLAFGRTGLVYGYFLSTVLLWHGTYTVNSLAHLMTPTLRNVRRQP